MQYDSIVRKIIKETSVPVVVYSAKGNELLLWANEKEYRYIIGSNIEEDVRKAIESIQRDGTAYDSEAL